MLIGFILLMIALLLFFGLKTVCAAANGRSLAGHRTLSKMSRWHKAPFDLWVAFPFKQLLAAVSRLVYVDQTTRAKLRKDLEKAGLPITPQEYIAKKLLVIVSCVCMMGFCFLFRFYFGVFIVVLATVFALMNSVTC